MRKGENEDQTDPPAIRGRQGTQDSRIQLLAAFGDEPFSSADIASIGMSRGQLRALLARGYVSRLHRDRFIATHTDETHTPTPVSRARIALAPLRGTPAVITGPLAGELHGLPFVQPPSSLPLRDSVEIMVLDSNHHRCGYRSWGVVVRRVHEFPSDVVVNHGIAMTSVLHAAIDMVRMGYRTHARSRARSLFLPEALVVLDAATAQCGARSTAEALDMISQLRPRFRYGPGIRTVDSIAELVEPLSESALESWSRGYMIEFAVPAPLIQQVVTGANGRDYRVDFCWPESKIIGEADGMEKYGESPREVNRAKNQELLRQRALEAAGWTVIRWTWAELASDPKAVMGRINQHVRRSRKSA